MHVVVTGATGKQGGAVARRLAAGGRKVTAIARDPGSPAARALAAEGIAVAKGDFGDPDGLARALDGADGLFAMGTSFEGGVEAEIEHGIALVNAARRAGVGHVVYTSVASADRKTGVPHFDSKARVEEALLASGLPWTILAPVYFMENLWFPQSVEGLKAGVYAVPLPPDRALQQVAVADIGAMGAVAFERRLVGRRIELAGDERTGLQAAAALSGALGREIRYQQIPLAALQGNRDLFLMYRYFDEVGYAVDREALRREFPEVGWRSLEAWLATQDLSALRS